MALLGRFRWTIGIVIALVLVGGLLFYITPHDQLGGKRPTLLTALYAAWMALFAQPALSPPQNWYCAIVDGVYPLLGFILIGEGLLRLSTLLISRERGETEWMKVMAKTYRDHTILCGLGHLGHRVLEQLVVAELDVVVIESDPSSRFVIDAKRAGIPLLQRDMRDDQALVEAGIASAKCIVIATNNDMANVEVALDARRMNPNIRIVMRMFDQTIADKMKDVMQIDHAFSSAALAAPVVAGFVAGAGVINTYKLGATLVETMELVVGAGSPLAGKTVATVEAAEGVRVAWFLRQEPELPRADEPVQPGDRIVVHGKAEKLASIRARLA